MVKPMIDRKWGRIINITTSLGTMLHGGSTPYGPSKASAEALSSVMAADLEGTGVTVNVIIPGGAVNTPIDTGQRLPLPAMRCCNPSDAPRRCYGSSRPRPIT